MQPILPQLRSENGVSLVRCVDCPHFKIAYAPMMPYDMGLARCTKYDLVCDFTSKRKLNRLECVKEEEGDRDGLSRVHG